jgi:hypothetical protein
LLECAEFSAWEASFQYLDARIETYDLVHLATSACDALGTWYLHYIDAPMLALLLGRSVALGHIDRYNEPSC